MSNQLTTEELNQLMKESAQDCIKYLAEFHNQHCLLRKDDLSKVDQVLMNLAVQHVQQPLSNPDIFTICSIIGAFVGEIFKNTVGGEWFMDTSIENAPYVVLNYAGKSYAFASICYEKLTKSPEISIAKYYELAIGGSTN